MPEPTSRRQFLATAGAALGVGPALAACGGAPTEASGCSGYGSLSEPELRQREALKYVDVTPNPAQNCLNCKFYQPELSGEGCGGCQLFPGPVVDNGWCQTWVAIEAA